MVRWLRAVTVTFLAFSLPVSAWAASGTSCERLAISKLSPGMSYNLVRLKMGGEGIQSVTRTSGSRETSAADYPGLAQDIYVEYDHPTNRRPTARAVLVRASMPLLPENVAELVGRFGAPDTGADDLSDGVLEGVAVWVNEPCGVVLTAYHPRESWWAAEGRTTLRLETLAAARRGDSPASSSLSAILERRHGPPATHSMFANLPVAPETPSPMMERLSDALETNGSLHVTVPTVENEIGGATLTTAAVSTPPTVPAERITYVPPVYPRTARWLGMAGHVTLAIAVKADGSVTSTPRVVAEIPKGQGFAEAAIEAVRAWRFGPAIEFGSPVASTLTIDVEFKPQIRD
jgi:TonB family protein